MGRVGQDKVACGKGGTGQGSMWEGWDRDKVACGKGWDRTR